LTGLKFEELLHHPPPKEGKQPTAAP